MNDYLNQLKEQTIRFKDAEKDEQQVSLLDNIKLILETAPVSIKGSLFEEYLAFLYRGNGYLATVIGGKGDEGADIIIRHPQNVENVFLIIQAKNHAKPLSFDDTRLEFLKFETQLAKKYHCKHYRLVSINGFSENCKTIEKTAMRMDQWEQVVSLIKSFELEQVESLNKTPRLELFAHNQLAYQELIHLLKNHPRAATIQATGTGKSFIILQLLLDYLSQPKIVIAPSKHILKSFKKKQEWSSQNTLFITYQKLRRMNKDMIKQLKADLIVFDELHRIGAKKWRKNCEALVAANPQAKVVGFSATPIRYTDNMRDMVSEFFNDIQTTELSLTRAIAEGIIPAPTYVSALYSLDPEISTYKEKVQFSANSEEEKVELLSNLENARVQWAESFGVDKVLAKHLPNTTQNMKFIVFCENIQHLEDNYPDILKWFHKATSYKTITPYIIHSERTNEDKVLKLFESNEAKNSLDLLFCVDKLNEGIHLKGISGVIFLRRTKSPNIYYQQMGRALSVGCQSPLIFDLVNNFENITCANFINDLNESFNQERRYRERLGVPYEEPNVQIYEHLKEVKSLFSSIESCLKSNWDLRYSELEQYFKVHGHSNVPQHYKENPALGRWVQTQKAAYKKGILSSSKIDKLNQLEFEWDPYSNAWDTKFKELMDYKTIHGHTNVPGKYEENPSLGVWVFNQRQAFKKTTLNQDRIDRLNSIGFEWELRKDVKRSGLSWDDYYIKLLTFSETYGHSFPSVRYCVNDIRLGYWASHQRSYYFRGLLTQEQRSKLEVFDFITYTQEEFDWNCRYQELVHFKQVNGHDDVPIEMEGEKLSHFNSRRLSFGRWVQKQRFLYKKKQLSQWKVDQLNMINFEWEFDKKWENMRQKLMEYAQIVGTVNFTRCNTINDSFYNLGIWCNNQRMAYRANKLSSYRIQKLEEIGFLWDLQGVKREVRVTKLNETWQNTFESFKSEFNKEGFSLEKLKETNIKLYRWINRQIRQFKNEELDARKLELLQEIGFDLADYLNSAC